MCRGILFVWLAVMLVFEYVRECPSLRCCRGWGSICSRSAGWVGRRSYRTVDIDFIVDRQQPKGHRIDRNNLNPLLGVVRRLCGQVDPTTL